MISLPRTIALTAALLVSGCASQIMEGYVGKSVQEPILDYGPPANVIRMNDGRRAYQWSMTNSGVLPMTTPSSATIYGSGGYANIVGQTTTYVPYSNDCLYTLTAQERDNDWIIDGYRKPRLACE